MPGHFLEIRVHAVLAELVIVRSADGGGIAPEFGIVLAGFEGHVDVGLGGAGQDGEPAAILIGALRAGSSQMQFSAGVAKEITDVIIALMLFFVAADQIVRWLLRGRLPEDEEKINISTSWGQ